MTPKKKVLYESEREEDLPTEADEAPQSKKNKEKNVTFTKGGRAIDPKEASVGLEDLEAVCAGLADFVRKIIAQMWLLDDEDGLDGKRLYFASLTVPTPQRTTTLLYGFANLFAEWCSEDGGTAWFMADWSQRNAGHWHGLVLSARTPDEMRKQWNGLSGGGHSSQDFQPVWHQDEPDSNEFVTSIAKIVISYASKDVSVDVSRTERAVAFGKFAEFWKECMGRPPMDASYCPPLIGAGAAAPRVCLYEKCGQAFVPTRTDQEYCSPKCRKKAEKARSKTKKKEQKKSKSSSKKPPKTL
jgi:hypothetical protein